VRIDLNADVGESFGTWRLGEDDRVIPLVSSVNIACGFHAGDPRTIERTVALAVEAGCAIGAHPGYPDLAGFGRRHLGMDPDEVEATILYQVGAVAAFAKAAGADLRHVKPHGALYNRAATDPALAESIARAVCRVSSDLILVGLAGSVMLDAGRAAGLTVAGEGFADRRYELNGNLRSRTEADAVIDEPEEVGRQAVAIALDGTATAVDGGRVAIAADTICIHGDLPGAARRAAAARAALEAAGVDVLPLGR
jgi:UPF0271 protein